SQRVEFGLAGALVPGKAVALGGGRFRLVGPIAVDELAPVIELVVDRLPAGQAVAEGRAEGRVLAPGAWQDGEEPAAVLMDVGHVLGGGQLAVGDVEEVAAAGQLTEDLPGADMGAVVGGVAALDAEVHRHGAVARDGEDVEQLLEVGAMVLVVAVSRSEERRVGKECRSWWSPED